MSTINAETIRRWVEEMWNGRQYSLCRELIAPGFIEHAHAPFSEHEPGRVDGPETMRASMDWLLAQFPDLSMSIEAMVSEGDLVAVRVLSTGTNLGAFNGVLPASGRTFRAEQTHWFRMTDGRIAEHWATRDDLTTMLQLGVVTRPRLGAALRQVGAAVRRRLRRPRS
jgi:predicted ester cyclase